MTRNSKCRNCWSWFGVSVLLLAGQLLPCRVSQQPPLRGVVVEEIKEGSALAKAGVRVGDVLSAWERLPSPPANPEGEQGEIASPFDWLWMEVEQAPRGTVKLTGERGGEPMAFVVEPGLWEAKVRPRMSGAILDAYLKGRELIDAEQLEEGTSSWRQAAEMAQHEEDWPLRCWLRLRVGQVWAEARLWEKAEETYGRAWEEAREPKAQVVVRHASGDAFRGQSEWNRAAEAYRSAWEITKATWGESLGVGKSLQALGSVAYYRGDLEKAEAYFQRALAITEKLAPDSLKFANTLNDLGVVISARGDLDRAEPYFERNLSITEKLAPNSLHLAVAFENVGKSAWDRGDLATALTYHQRALAIIEKLAPNSLDLARGLDFLGVLARERGDFDAAESYYQDALSITERLAPNSLHLAHTLGNLANVTADRGDFDAAEKYIQRALSIEEKLAPNTLHLARTLANLGAVFVGRGDLEAGEAYHLRALAITEKLAPSSLGVSGVLSNLGDVARQRGDLARAEAYLRHALNITEELAPNSLQLAHTFDALGIVAFQCGDMEAAETYCQRALSIKEKLAPNSLSLSMSLNTLGMVACERGDLAVGEAYFERVLAITEKFAPHSLTLAATLANLGNVAGDRRDLDGAEAYYQRALAIAEKVAPNSLGVSGTLMDLGNVAVERGDLEAAEDYIQRALAIADQLAPDTLQLAQELRALGMVFRKNDRLNEAADHLIRAIEALEGQITRLGISHERQGGYRARRDYIYGEAIEVLLELGRSEQAFHTLERFRARSLLAMLAERDIIFSTDVPKDLEKDRKLLAKRYDRILEQMATLDAEKDHEAIDEFSKQLKSLQRERDEVAARIRQVSPQLADLQYPQPLTLPQVQKVLDRGTVMVSYSVGEDETHVFVVTREKGLVAVESLAVGEEKLRQNVDGFRRAIVHGTDPRSQFFEPVRDAGRELCKVLIRPVVSSIEHSDRVLIIADGPLHLLPFGALIRESGEYLAEWKPLHFVLSATLYGQLQRARPQPDDSPAMFAAFGDPVYPENLRRDKPDQIADVRVRAAVKRGLFDWEPLPHTRREVEGITALYPAERVHPYLGEEAIEERAKGLPRTTDVVHFAAHGHLDDRFPLNSAVVLTIPEGFPEDRDNGLLQAWEIFERVRIDADLVVLSACQSALGEERGGEGLIGLTRAFQYAGARTVVATLWQVADEVTAELMVRFYRHLRAGKSKDAALQAAQIELIRGPIEVRKRSGKVGPRDGSAPYYWAAFQVIGDWR